MAQVRSCSDQRQGHTTQRQAISTASTTSGTYSLMITQTLLVDVYVDHMYVEDSQHCFQVQCVEVDSSESGNNQGS